MVVASRKSRKSSHTYGPPCQHPKTRAAGLCERLSIGEFEIPDTYDPPKRHRGQPDIPRPKSLLCRQHWAMVQAHAKGTDAAGNSHELWCDICQHPRGADMMMRWITWQVSTEDVLVDLNVGHTTFYRHVHYFKLLEKKGSKVNTKQALVRAAELGFSAGGHDARTALTALKLLAEERGDAKKVEQEVEVTVKGMLGLGVVDLTRMTTEELAAHAEAIARMLRGEPQTKQLPAAGVTVIDLPSRKVAARAPASTHTPTPTSAHAHMTAEED